MPPEIRRVERDLILPLRRAVLSEPGVQVAALSGDLSPRTRHWAAVMDDGSVVGCVSVMHLRGLALRGMAVATEHQGQGLGARLLLAVQAQVGEAMWCNARLSAAGFYEHMGWRRVGPVFVMQNAGKHQRMVWEPR